MRQAITEEDLEEYVLDILKNLNYKIIKGDEEKYLPDGTSALRKDYKKIIIEDKLRESLIKINPNIPTTSIDDAIKQIHRSSSQKLITNNEEFHKLLVDGIDVSVKTKSGERFNKVWIYDFENPKNNEFLAINQFTILGNSERRPDIILFINGIPLVVLELKSPADEKADIWSAYNQFQTYKKEIPDLFRFNEILIISDGIDARSGTITTNKERFMKWKTINGDKPEKNLNEIELLIRGMCDKEKLLDIIRNFITFEKKRNIRKILAAYNQYWATNKAIQSTIAAGKGDRKAGIVWHTQGSGKSFTMIFYSGKLIQKLDNPTIVVLTDRNDLDDQLFGDFAGCQDILRQKPVQANNRENLKELLKVASGGIVFTTIQKFFPEQDSQKYPALSRRDNIIVIVDEAHRSQYGFASKIITKKDKISVTYGYAKHLRDALPNASFIGFTGTPIEKLDRSTPAVFGKYVDKYDIEQAVNDGSTVQIYYESRLAKIELKPEERPRIDDKFEDVTEGQEKKEKEILKSKWSKVEKVVGTPSRIKKIAADIVEHFENRQEILDGKAMIVCMSRRICVDLYDAIIKIRPRWHNDNDDEGFIKVVMTGSASDSVTWQKHIRTKRKRKTIGENFKEPENNLKIIIVRDMFLTGFDAPSLHTMYLDKYIKSHTLMQTIARVNRVYPGKEGGLIVDYMGVLSELRNALGNYTSSGGKGKLTVDYESIIKLMNEKYEIVKDLFYGFDYKKFFTLEPKNRMSFIPDAMEHILNGKKDRYLKEVTALLKVFSIVAAHNDAQKIKDDVGLFQAIKSAITKTTDPQKQLQIEKFDTAINQIISKALISDKMIDIFQAAGLNNPEISILSDRFLAQISQMPQKNLAFEALQKLLRDEIRTFSKKNIVLGKSFLDMLDKAIKKYTNKTIDAVQVIEELIKIAHEFKDIQNRGKKLNMSQDELAFYDALEVNYSAVKILGDSTLKTIALELTEMIRNSVTIDWTRKASVQATIRLKVKKILRRYGYPPNKEEKATYTVLAQAEVIAKEWINLK